LAGPDARGPKGSLGRVPGDGPARSRPDSKSSRQGEGACGNVKVLVIVGPTGVGKTEVACLVAREIGGEIVSADSRQMYRGLDIGTDKPDRATLKMIPHHMVDVLDPAEQFDAARFAAMARDCFEEISARGKVPILVGGSGLYVKAALYGLFKAPSRDEDLRARLLKEDERRPGGMHARLVKVDPDRASELDRADLQRIVRALEFYELTGRKMSRSLKEWSPQSWPHVAVGLVRPRGELYRRIDARVEEMIRQGLLMEVQSLLEGGLDAESPGLRSIGYREAVACLAGEITSDDAVALIQRHSRRYAKRQMTWFKRMSVTRWISVGDPGDCASQIVGIWGAATC
jgi:tRNA dimethylallyltransferase